MPDDRESMVQQQLVARGILDDRVLAAMRSVPRRAFVPRSFRPVAYEDCALPIGCGQTISQPYIVARMLELAAIRPEDTVLEIGAGSGYAAAVAGEIAARVIGLERHANLAAAAGRHIANAGISNVTVFHRDGAKGMPEEAPFDVIIVSAGGAAVPPALFEQLAPGGRLVMPVGGRDGRVLKRYVREADGRIEAADFDRVQFVPFIDAPERR